MNFQIISYIIGWVIFLEGSFMILPLLTAIVYGERTGVIFAVCSVACLIGGYIMMRKKPKNSLFFAREGFVTVALSWIVLSIIGALPFYISGEIPNFIDAVFETVSGFTTTGASILSDVEALSKMPAVLAQLYSLDRRYGSACIHIDNPPSCRRTDNTPDACRKPRPFHR